MAMYRASVMLVAAVCVAASLPAGVWAGVGGACELCGRVHANQAPVYVTDWETNSLHRFGSLDCALEAMRTRYPWSRAALADCSTGERITVTRAQDRWTVRPEEAVIVVHSPETEGGCPSYDVYNSRDEFMRYAKKHRREVAAGASPERLSDFVEALIARQGGAQAASAVPASPQPQERKPAWTGDAVETVKAEGIMEGYPDGSFGGDNEVTRYEMAVIAQRLLKRLGVAAQPSGDAGLPTGAAGGPDLPAKERVGELVQALEDELTAAGANRGEVAAALEVLAEAAEQGVTVPPAISASTDWPDVPPEHWAHEAVVEVTAAGIMNGYPDHTFRGERPLTRYEIAVIAARLLSRVAATSSPALEEAEEQPPAPEDQTPTSTERQPVSTPPEIPAAAHPTKATADLDREARAHLLGLKAQLMLSGLSEEEADRVLDPVRRAMTGLQTETVVEPQLATVEPATSSPASEQPPKASAPEQPTALPSAPSLAADESEPGYPKVQEPNMLGVSGFLLTPSADTNEDSDSIKVGISRALGSNLIFGSTSALGGFELGLLSTSGDLPSRIVLNAKRQVWRSSDGRSRIAIGLLDATDEIDTTLYGVYSKSFRSRFLDSRPRDWTLSVGLGGGDLLDGLFGSVYVPLSERLAVGAEVVDLGDSGNQLNYGFEYRLGRGWRLKAGIVDGDLAAQAAVERGL